MKPIDRVMLLNAVAYSIQAANPSAPFWKIWVYVLVLYCATNAAGWIVERIFGSDDENPS